MDFGNSIGKVYFCEERALFVLEDINVVVESRIMGLANIETIARKFEVIGNIYENQELLETSEP